MGVFQELGGMGYPAESAKAPERCQPDFEAIVKRLQKNKSLSTNLLHSLEIYTEHSGHSNSTFTLSQLVGALYLEIRECDRMIEATIREQEAFAARQQGA